MNTQTTSGSPRLVAMLGVLFVALYGIGMVFPESWWGVHYLAFMAKPLNLILLVAALALVVLGIGGKRSWKAPDSLKNMSRQQGTIAIWLISAVMASIFYNFPIDYDTYGDAFQNRNYLNQISYELPPDFFDTIFSFDLKPSGGRKTMLYIFGWFSHIFTVDHSVIFKWVTTLCGFGYAAVWLFFVRNSLRRFGWRVLLGLAGLSAPFTLLYYGHLETYAPVFLMLLVWIILLVKQVKTENKRLLLILGVLWLIGFKMHGMFLLMIVPLILAVYRQYKPETTLFDWKQMGLKVYAPLFLLGLAYYFFVAEDWNDPRHMEGVKDAERLFLPLVSPEAPLDRYNLLSFNHIFDFVQMILLWCPPVLFLLVALRSSYRKLINWTDPIVMMVASGMILMIGLLFMTNPLVGMPMDWDLFSFPAPLLMVIAVLLIGQIEQEDVIKSVGPGMAGLVLMCLPVFVVNASTHPHSYRMESIGRHSFKTFYLRSGQDLITAIGMPGDDMELYLERKEKILEDLKPYALEGNDPMYANLLMDDGFYFLEYAKQPFRALPRLEEALKYNPDQPDIKALYNAAVWQMADQHYKNKNYEQSYQLAIRLVNVPDPNQIQAVLLASNAGMFAGKFNEVLAMTGKWLSENDPENPNEEMLNLHKIALLRVMEGKFMAKDFEAAYEDALRLIDLKFPAEDEAMRIAIHCALEAKFYDKALSLSRVYLTGIPGDQLIQQVVRRIEANDRVEELRLLFAQGQQPQD